MKYPKKPVLIYGQDSRPKYYEYVIYDAENKAVGTIKTKAKKTSNGVLSEVINAVRDYQAIVSKGSGGMKFFEGTGNNLLLGMPSKSGEQPTTLLNVETGETVEPGKELTDEEKLEIITETIKVQSDEVKNQSMSIEDTTIRKKLLKSQEPKNPQERITELKSSMEVAHQNRDDFWDEMETISDTLISLNDDDITNKTTKFWGWFSSLFNRIFNRGSTKEEYYLDKYKYASERLSYSSEIKKNRFCGPFALAWMYKAKYNSNVDKSGYFKDFSGTGLALPSFKIYGGIIDLVSLIVKVATDSYPLTPVELFYAYGTATGFKSFILPYFSFGRDNAHDHIKYKRGPIIIFKWLSEPHWVVGWKSERENNWYLWDKHWFTVNDNSAFGRENDSEEEKYTYRRYTRKFHADWPMMYLKVYE